MKKNVIILIIVCLLICGCGKKEASKKVTEVVKKSEIGNTDLIYKVEISCGDKKKDSYVKLNKDKTVEYALYECNDNNLELIYGEGNYAVKGSNITITDSYNQQISINVSNEESIELNVGNTTQTFTK